LALLAVCSGLSANALNLPLTWQWSNPSPHGNNIIDMANNSGVLTVQVCERGQVYVSEDFVSWLPVDTHTTRDLRAVTFLGAHPLVTGESGTVLYGDSATEFRLLDLETEDWLEGVAASSNTVVAVGDNGAIYTSSDGLQWQRRPQAFSVWLRSVAYGGGVFVAVGEGGFVATSSDGVAWQVRSSGTTADLNKVAWAGDRFWTVGDGGVALSSANGQNWQPVSSGASNALFAAVDRNGALLVGGDSELRLFRDGVWSNQLDPSSPNSAPAWTYYQAVDNGRGFLVGGRSGVLVEGVFDGSGALVWTNYSRSLRNWLWDISRASDLYVAVGDRATIMTSDNGLDWNLELVPDSATNSIFLGIGGSTNLQIVVGDQGTVLLSRNTVTNLDGTNVVGTLGVVWEAVQPRPSAEDLQGITTYGETFIVTGGNGTILASTNGTDWSARPSATTAFLSGVAAFPGGLVAVGKHGTILTSPDSVSWTPRSSGTTNWIYRVRYLNGLLIAVGQQGTVLTSTDGITWTPRTTGTTSWINEVVFMEGSFIAIGNQGTVLISPDASDWSEIGTITKKSLFGASFAHGQLVTVGVEGVILRSQVAPANAPGILNVSPAAGFSGNGTVGGPFAPSQQTYTLRNLGQSALTWTAAGGQNWLTCVPPAGSLAPGATTEVVVEFGPEADTLTAGSHSTTINFVNTSDGNGSVSHEAVLTVDVAPGILGVAPSGEFIAGGRVGGPFAPASRTYFLTNSGGSSLAWTANAAENWVTLSPASGNLAPGGSAEVSVSFNSSAHSLPAGEYLANVHFVNVTGGQGNSYRAVRLVVDFRPGLLVVFPESDFVTAGPAGGPFTPGQMIYALTNSGGTTLSWGATASEPWLTFAPSSGSLAPGESVEVRVSLFANPGTLLANSSDMLSFVNTTDGNGSTVRAVSVSVAQPPLLKVVGTATPNQFRLRVLASAGLNGVVQATSDLVNWSSISTNTTGPDGVFEVVDPAAPAANLRFYRVLLLP
jgi:hypothetical protein